MSNPVSSLPESWVEHIWATMRATYGAAFDRQWACPEGVEPAEHVRQLKAVWGRELARFQQSKASLSYGLENLPERPPNLIEFKAICGRMPHSDALALPSPPASEAHVRRVLNGLDLKINRGSVRPAKAWALALQAREQRGENLTQFQRDAWRTALKANSMPVEQEEPA